MRKRRVVVDLGEPSEWCDRRCGGCPILERCRVGRRWLKRSRARAAPSEGGPLSDVVLDLEEAMRLLEDEWGFLEERALDVTMGPVGGLSAGGIVIELTSAAAELAEAAVQAGVSYDVGEGPQLLESTVLVALKTTQLAVGVGGEAVLLLVEHGLGQLDAAARMIAPLVPAKVRARFEGARAALGDLLQPWLLGVSAQTRAALGELVEARRAPSPFCRTGLTVAGKANIGCSWS